MNAARWRHWLPGGDRSAARRRRGGRTSGRRGRRAAFVAEALEERRLLTVPLVTPHGGPVLANVEVETVYWGWNMAAVVPGLRGLTYGGLATTLNNFYKDITASGYMTDLAQYGAGKGTFGVADNVTPVAGTPTALPAAPGPVTTTAIQAMLANQMAPPAGGGPAPLPAYTGKQLYIVFPPPGMNVQIIATNGQNVRVVTSGMAFHTWNGYPYAVMPFPNANTLATIGYNALDYLTALSSHEMVEGITDPVATYTSATTATGTGWYYLTTAFEIGDPLNGAWFTYPKEAGFVGGPYVVQAYWSNLIGLSTEPHEWPLLGGNTSLPGVGNSPSAIATQTPVRYVPSAPGTSTPRPTQPASPPLPTPTPPTPPTHTGPAIPGGGSLVQPTIVASPFNPSVLAVASQNGVVLSTNGGASWGSPIAFPTASAGDSSLVFDKKGNLYWSYLNPTTGGITIVTLNPSTGAVAAGPFTVDAPASGYTDVQQVLTADFSTGSSTSNNIAIVWSQLGPSGSSKILLSISTNQGKTWLLAPVTVAASDGETPPTYYYGATATFGPDGSIDVAYHAQPGYSVASDGGIVPDGLSGETLVAIYTYDSTTQTLNQQGSTLTAFGAGQSDITFNDQAGSRKIAGTTFLTQGSVIPQILADPTVPNTLYVVTVQDPDAGTANPPSSEVVIATLTESPGGTWSTTTAAIAPPSSASTFQLFPTATIDSVGDIVVSWYANASGQKNGAGDYLLDTDATYSVDGGQTWATPFALDSQPFDPDPDAADVLPGPPPTTGIGNSLGVTIDGATVFVANDANTYSGSTATGQTVAVESFLMPGTLFIPTNLGNNVITIGQQSSGSGVDVVQINGVTVFVGSLASLSGGIVIGALSQVNDDIIPGPSPDVENDTLILNYSNGDPVPAGGITFDGAEGGTNTIEANADANYMLSDSALTISGNAVTGTDTINLDNVNNAQLTGGPSNDTFTLNGWSGTTTITGGSGTNAMVVAGGTVTTSSLSVSHVQSLSVTGGTFDVNTSFASIPTVQVEAPGILELDIGVTLTADVTNAGTLMLGSGTTTADATIAGAYIQTSAGTLDIKLGGTAAGQFDQLHVTGNVTLSGTLDVSLVNSFVPTTGDSFQIITYLGTLAGDFTTKNFPTLGDSNTFTTSSGSGSYTLTVTS